MKTRRLKFLYTATDPSIVHRAMPFACDRSNDDAMPIDRASQSVRRPVGDLALGAHAIAQRSAATEHTDLVVPGWLDRLPSDLSAAEETEDQRLRHSPSLSSVMGRTLTARRESISEVGEREGANEETDSDADSDSKRVDRTSDGASSCFVSAQSECSDEEWLDADGTADNHADGEAGSDDGSLLFKLPSSRLHSRSASEIPGPAKPAARSYAPLKCFELRPARVKAGNKSSPCAGWLPQWLATSATRDAAEFHSWLFQQRRGSTTQSSFARSLAARSGAEIVNVRRINAHKLPAAVLMHGHCSDGLPFAAEKEDFAESLTIDFRSDIAISATPAFLPHLHELLSVRSACGSPLDRFLAALIVDQSADISQPAAPFEQLRRRYNLALHASALHLVFVMQSSDLRSENVPNPATPAAPRAASFFDSARVADEQLALFRLHICVSAVSISARLNSKPLSSQSTPSLSASGTQRESIDISRPSIARDSRLPSAARGQPTIPLFERQASHSTPRERAQASGLDLIFKCGGVSFDLCKTLLQPNGMVAPTHDLEAETEVQPSAADRTISRHVTSHAGCRTGAKSG